MAKGKNTFKDCHAVEYSVVWDRTSGRFNVYRDRDPTPCFSPQKGVAVGLAIREAHREATKTGEKIIVTSMRNGQRIVEWDGIMRS